MRQRLDVVVNILTNLAYHKRKITVFGGEQLRPNIHITDMVKAYECLVNAPKSKISGEIFNAGYENQSVLSIAKLVKKIVGEDVTLEVSPTNDNRSYHISSEKISKVLNFKTTKTIEDAIVDLKNAFDKKLLPNSLDDEKYFNIKKNEQHKSKMKYFKLIEKSRILRKDTFLAFIKKGEAHVGGSFSMIELLILLYEKNFK